eukprot:TRINITY_DN33453_c0_g1_i1.p1 TRINITY_DN33453_c0_g1~~TRINITY_DN33453_c0_g1_i1.p1  ORF type:complete len:553 (-),score=94.75 TRINITY_DN33453_c0_g1_i1:55-1713(-)
MNVKHWSTIKLTMNLTTFLIFLLSISTVFALEPFSQSQSIFSERESCETCRFVVNVVLTVMETNRTEAALVKEWNHLCPKLASRPAACPLIANMFGPDLFKVLDRIDLDDKLCYVIGACHNQPKAPFYVSPQPPMTEKTPSNFLADLPIVVLADLHLDPLYDVGSDADCNWHDCCRFGRPTQGNIPASPWGEWRCDIPVRMAEALVKEASVEAGKRVDGDFSKLHVFWMGDAGPHDQMNNTLKETSEATIIAMDLIKHYFPGSSIYPVLGNHEYFPMSFFDPKEKPEALALYSQIMDPLLETEEEKASFRAGGMFTRVVREGLRVITLNGQLGDIFNIWHLTWEFEDPLQMFPYLHDQLSESCAANEQVIIMTHVPLFTTEIGVYPYYSTSIANIMGAFPCAQILLAGHTHSDAIQYVGLPSSPYPVIGLAAPSGTTSQNRNPSFRIMTFDQENKLAGYDTYRTENPHNAGKELEWKLAYTAPDAFGMKNFSVEELLAFHKRMADSDEEFEKWYSVVFSSGNPTKNLFNHSKAKRLCEMMSVSIYDYVKCMA